MRVPLCAVAFLVMASSCASCVLGADCSAPQLVDEKVGSEHPPSVAVGGAGVLVAWAARLPDQRQVTRVAAFSNCGWDRLGADVSPDEPSLRSPAPQLAATPAGLFLLTTDGAGETYAIARLHHWDQTQWRELARYDSDEPGTARVTSARLRVDGEGTPWLAVEQAPVASTARHVLLRWDGAALVKVADGPAAASGTPVGFDLALDAQLRPTLAWAGGTDTAPTTEVARWTGDAWEALPTLAERADAFAVEPSGTPLALVTRERGCQLLQPSTDAWTPRGFAASAYDDGSRVCQQLTVDATHGIAVGWTELTAYERPGIYVRRLESAGWQPVIASIRDSDDAARIAFALRPDTGAPVLAWTEVPLGGELPMLLVRVAGVDEVD